MERVTRRYVIDVTRLEPAVELFTQRYADLSDRYRNIRRRMITQFVADLHDRCLCKGRHLMLTERRLMQWIKHTFRTNNPETAIRRIVAGDRFCAYLADELIVQENPFSPIRRRVGARGWKGVVGALRDDNPARALAALRPTDPLGGTIGRLVRMYLDVRRAGGAKLRTNEVVLTAFNRFLRARRIDDPRKITPGLVLEWSRRCFDQPHTRRWMLLRLRQFFAYITALKVIHCNPVTPAVINSWGPRGPAWRPYIYSHDEIQALLVTAAGLKPDLWFKLKPALFTTLIALLYTLGLRLGEALRLQIRDVDLERAIVFVRRSKFFKERFVPFGPNMAQRFEAYLDARRAVFGSPQQIEPVFLGRNRTQLRTSKIDKVWPNMLRAAGITARHGGRRPRLHDLRHTFASLLIQAGESLAYVRDQLGHHDISLTVNTYGHLVPGSNKEAVDRLDDINIVFAVDDKEEQSHITK